MPERGFARHSINGTVVVTHKGRAYIPKRATALKERMMTLGHEVALHANAFATTRAIADAGVTWDGVKSDVASWIQACPECQYARCPRQRRIVGELEPTLPPSANHTVYADYFMTSTASESGAKCLCVLIDGLTRWMEIYPFSTANADNTIACLEDWSDRFGLPVVLRTDNGRHFDNVKVEEWCKSNNVTFKLGLPYHHQGQGIVERPLRDVISKVIVDCGADIHRWAEDNRPRRIAAAHNRTPIGFLGMSPFKMTYGREPRTPLNASVGWSPPAARSIEELHRTLSSIQEAALLGSAVAQLRNRVDHASRAKRAPVFEPGDYVLVMHERAPTKLLSSAQGVYKVVQRLNGDVYRVHRTLAPNETSDVHVARLLRFNMRRTDDETEALRRFPSTSNIGLARKIVNHGVSPDGSMYFSVEWHDGTTTEEPASGIHRLNVFKEYVARKGIPKSQYSPRTPPPDASTRRRSRTRKPRRAKGDSDDSSSSSGGDEE